MDDSDQGRMGREPLGGMTDPPRTNADQGDDHLETVARAGTGRVSRRAAGTLDRVRTRGAAWPQWMYYPLCDVRTANGGYRRNA